MSPSNPAVIRDMFNTLVPGYDRFNRISSLGLDVHWRRELAEVLRNQQRILDVGTGTGDVAHLLAAHGASVVGVDFSEKMVLAARRKMQNVPGVSFEVARAESLPFPSGEFDGISSAFVIRNLNHGGVLGAAFREFYRVLGKGGLMVHLELSRPPKGVISWGHQVYLRAVLPMVGRMVFGRRWPKDYLSKTIDEFPDPREICQRIRWAGFNRVTHYSLSGGIASLFCGVKC